MNKVIFSNRTSLEEGTFFFSHKADRITENSMPSLPHVHDQYEIYFFREGNIRCSVEGNIYDIAPDDFLITNPRELHRPIVTAPCFYRRKRIMVSPSFLMPFLTQGYSPFSFFENRVLGTCNKISHTDTRSRGLISLFRKIESCVQTETPENTVMVKVYLMELLFKMSKIVVTAPARTATASDIAKDVLLYINNHIDEDLSYEAISRKFHISPNSLYRFFLQNTGFAPGEYIQGRRIVKAKALLTNGVPARVAAEQVGFAEYSTFYRAFVKHTGITPAKFSKS